MSLAATVATKANLIWAIADKLTGAFKPHQYGEVILPLTVIRRFDSVLDADTRLIDLAETGSRPTWDMLYQKAFSRPARAWPSDTAARPSAICSPPRTPWTSSVP
mgnify:CR=1 FL=1